MSSRTTAGFQDEHEPLRPWATDLEYLHAELAWIQARCERLGLEQRRDRVPGQRAARRGAFSLRVEDRIAPELIGDFIEEAGQIETALRRENDARLELHRTIGPELALDRLVRTNGLDDLERMVLLLAAGPCVSRRFEVLYGGFESDENDSLTVDAIFTFAGLSFSERIAQRSALSPRGRLLSKDLVEMHFGGGAIAPKDLLSTEVQLRGRTFSCMLGDTGLGDELADLASVEDPRATFDQLVLAESDKRRILGLVEGHDRYLASRRAWGLDDVIPYGRGALLLLHGPPGTGKTMTAHAVAHRLGKRVLNVDIPTFLSHADAGRFVPGLFREARLQDAILFFDECEGLFQSRRAGNALMTVLLTEVERFEGIAILATNLPDVLDEALDWRILVRIRFPEPDRDARVAIWRNLLPSSVPLAPDVDLAVLADRHQLAGGYIKNAVLVAAARAIHEATEGEARITHAMLEAAAEEQSARGVGDDEPAPAVPRARLSDVVLAPEAQARVDELVAMARSRRTVLERWGLGEHLDHGKGIAALFHGEPGTGKTLCAQAIAGELHRPLLHAAISALLSPWVGESERHITALFARARKLGAIVLLDEADALLGDRQTAGPARHEVSAVNVLLSEIDRFDGIVLLATNLPARLDRALQRRLSFQIELRLPEAPQRAAIWRRLLDARVPIEGELDLDGLAERHTLSGAGIKNAVFRAAFRAAVESRTIAQVDLESAAEDDSARVSLTNRRLGFRTA